MLHFLFIIINYKASVLLHLLHIITHMTCDIFLTNITIKQILAQRILAYRDTCTVYHSFFNANAIFK